MRALTHLCFVVPSLRHGGAERVVVTLLRHLDRSRFRLSLIVVDGREAEILPDVPADVRVEDLRCSRVLASLPRLVSATWRLRPDLIFSIIGHLNVAIAGLRPVLPPGVKLIAREATMISAGTPTGVRGAVLRLAYRALYRRADAIVCQSEEMQADFIRRVGVTPAKCVVIANPVDVDRVRQLAMAALEPVDEPYFAAADGRTLVAVGRLSAVKGFDLLVEAMSRVADQGLRVLVVGEGPERERLEALARSTSLEGRVHFLGFRANPYALIGRCDAFVLSSRVEGLPNVVLEALTLGVPIVALPAVGVTRRLLKSRAACWIADDISAEALAASLDKWSVARGAARVTHDLSAHSVATVKKQFEDVILRVLRGAW